MNPTQAREAFFSVALSAAAAAALHVPSLSASPAPEAAYLSPVPPPASPVIAPTAAPVPVITDDVVTARPIPAASPRHRKKQAALPPAPKATPYPSYSEKPPVARHVAVYGSAEGYAESLVGPAQFACLKPLWDRESGWNPYAENPTSGAYGIPQALPGDKMASAGPDWRTNPDVQVRWGISYVDARYGSPCGAWAHEEAQGWY